MVVIGLCVALTAYIAVVRSLSAVAKLLHAADGVQGGAVHARQLRAAYGSSDTARLFWNSLQFAVGASLFSFVLARRSPG